MYLVEEFKDALHLKLKPRTLEQAISNVQVVITLRTRKYTLRVLWTGDRWVYSTQDYRCEGLGGLPHSAYQTTTTPLHRELN